MLVTLGSNTTIGAGASQTFQYACNSLQKVFINCDDDGSDSLSGHVTVQIGNDVICNDINFRPLALLSLIKGGGKVDAGESYFAIDFGSHILDPLENVYVTIRNSAGTSLTALDVGAIVNEGGVYEPYKYTNYEDKVFTDTNTLSIYAWNASGLQNDTTAFTIRNQSYSSTPQVQTGVNVAQSMDQSGSVMSRQISALGQNQVPLDTSINYTSTAITGVLCISAMPKQPTKAQSSRSQGEAILASMTPAERKAL